jgi:hypothetical protein
VLDDAGLDVASASVARPTLDDVYLRHTGRSFAAGGRFLEFLTPGVIMMTAVFASVWAGTTHIQDVERGVMDRMLTSPVSRGALMASTLAYQSIVSTIQTLVVVGIALPAGARFPGGLGGVLVTILAAVLLTVAFAPISNAVALIVRQQQAPIGISQLLTLPLWPLCSGSSPPGRRPWIVVGRRRASLAGDHVLPSTVRSPPCAPATSATKSSPPSASGECPCRSKAGRTGPRRSPPSTRHSTPA